MHLIRTDSNVFIFVAEYYFIVYIYVPHLLYPFIFQALAILNSVAKIPQCIFFSLVSSGYMPRSLIAGSYGFIYSFLRNLHTVFHSGCISYIPTSSVERFPFLHTLSNTCCLWNFFFLMAVLSGVK